MDLANLKGGGGGGGGGGGWGGLKSINSLLEKPICEVVREGTREHEMFFSGNPHFFLLAIVLVWFLNTNMKF